MEKNGSYRIVMDGRPVSEEFKTLWDPVFSPDGEKLLIRGVGRGENADRYMRIVSPVSDLLA